MKSRFPVFALFLLGAGLLAQSPHSVVVTDVRFAGLNDVPQAVQADLAARFKGKTFHDEDWVEELKERTRQACQHSGYFKAEVDAKLEPLQQDLSQQQVAVDVAANEGPQFRLKDIQISGAKVFPAEQLRALFSLQPGEVFDTERIKDGLVAARRLYAGKGYIDFTPIPDTKINEATQLIEVIIQMDEGAQYRLRYAVLGPESRAARSLSSYLRPWTDTPYNPAMLDQLYADNRSLFHSHEDFQARTKIERDTTNHFVNLIINLNY
jgi:outer membrane protein assembly factor BamA